MTIVILYAILSMLFFGGGVFLYKMGTTGFSSGLGASIYILSHMIVLGALAFWEKTKFSKESFKFLIWGGILSGLAQLFFFLALRSGKIHTVVPIRNLSLVVTVLLGFIFLSEQITYTKGLGLLCASAAIVLLSI